MWGTAPRSPGPNCDHVTSSNSCASSRRTRCWGLSLTTSPSPGARTIGCMESSMRDGLRVGVRLFGWRDVVAGGYLGYCGRIDGVFSHGAGHLAEVFLEAGGRIHVEQPHRLVGAIRERVRRTRWN